MNSSVTLDDLSQARLGRDIQSGVDCRPAKVGIDQHGFLLTLRHRQGKVDSNGSLAVSLAGTGDQYGFGRAVEPKKVEVGLQKTDTLCKGGIGVIDYVCSVIPIF